MEQSGNVLFLILIAVALFAALSYAVTSSSRSGGGNANSETNLVNSASITQYPSALRTSIIRMMVSSGVDAGDLVFAPPSVFSSECDTDAKQTNCVFHPSGGGASPNSIPADLMVGSTQGTWYVSANYGIENVGTSLPDIIAFVPGISNALCSKLNEELGISGDTTSAADFAVTTAAFQMDDTAYSIPGSATDVIGDADQAGLSAQAFGCLTDSTPDNIYYHVLIER